jgi:tetratricopeptide (TPR) repeat protein
MKFYTRAFLLLVGMSALSAAANIHDPRAIEADPANATDAIAPKLAGLGTHSLRVTTSSAESQYFFDQGLRLTYGFNHSEALRSFKEAVRLDPENAMAYWGWALVLGPNINLPMQPDVAEQTFAAMQNAVLLKDKVTDVERAYIDALAVRYAPVAPDNRRSLDVAYANAMRELSERFPDDLDAATLYGAALMNLSPWDYWAGDGQPKPNTETFIATFESVLERAPDHPGAIHYYIHAVEVARPKAAEASADILRHLMPGAGHMVHMPSHIYMRVGRYADAYSANREASNADSEYIAQCNAQGIYPLNYYPHNLHFMVWAAMFQGRSVDALAGAREVQTKIPRDMGNGFGVFETFLSQPLYVMVRFGLWDKALAEPKPESHYRFMTGVWHYMRGMAYANTGERRKARAELRKLKAVRDELGAEYTIGFQSAPTLLTIAEQVLAGDMAAVAGDFEDAIFALSRAVRLEDSLRYSEPPDWYFPTRHVLGAILLQAGEPVEAASVYWQDLKHNPENAYALLGMSQALAAQGDKMGAEVMAKRFTDAWAAADVELKTSLF